MAGRPRTMANRVGRLLAQATDFDQALKRVMPAAYSDAKYDLTSADEIARNWSCAQDHSESLVECLETLSRLLLAKVEGVEALGPRDVRDDSESEGQPEPEESDAS